MDWHDFVRPYGFNVRYYDDTLSYKLHSALPYKTSSPRHLVYKVMRSRDKVNLWFADDEIVAQLHTPRHTSYQTFPIDLPVTHIVCNMLSRNGKLVVLDDDSLQPALF